MDIEYRKYKQISDAAGKATEAKAQAEYAKLVAEEQNADSEAAVTAAVHLVEAADAAAELSEKAKKAADSLKKHHYHMRTLVMKQQRERGALVYALGTNLKGLKADALGGEGAGEDGEPDATPLIPMPTLESKGDVSVSFTSSGTTACGWCGSRIDKLSSVECSECHRSFCGFGGHGLEHHRGGPCVDLYQCSCKSRLCHECYMAGVERRSMQWGFCQSCNSWMCVKETSGRAASCKFCSLNPICRSCRGHHEKTCPEKYEVRDSEDEFDSEEEEDDE